MILRRYVLCFLKIFFLFFGGGFFFIFFFSFFVNFFFFFFLLHGGVVGPVVVRSPLSNHKVPGLIPGSAEIGTFVRHFFSA